IGNESEIHSGTAKLISALAERGQTARVFGYGLGASVNRALIDGIGKHGQGTSVYSSTREDPTLPVNTFFRYIDHPILTDLDIDWGGLAVSDVFPTVKPDLFASRPTIIHGRYEGSGDETIRIRGIADGRAQSMKLSVSLPKRESANAALATLWARSKIEDLERDAVRGKSATEVERAITDLALDFRVVTRFTSFVAVDKQRSTNGKLTTVVQPVETPEGVDASTATPARGCIGCVGATASGGHGVFKNKSGGGYGFGALASRPAPPMGEKKVQRRRALRRKSVSKAPLPAPEPVSEVADDIEKEEERQTLGARERRALILELKGYLEAKLSAVSGGNARTVELTVQFTLSRNGVALQPRILAGLEKLTKRERSLILRELRRFQSEQVSPNQPRRVTLKLELAL
ncbi:MAG: hypothetical protein AAF658_11635, partial [Myxococcota bacterium]